MTARCSPPWPPRSPWPSPSMLSRRTMTGPSTGVFQMPVYTVLSRHCAFLGMPTLTETSLPMCLLGDQNLWKSLGQRFAAVDLERHAGHESVGHREQHRVGDVIGGSDSPSRVAGSDVLGGLPLTVLTQCVPCAGIDHPGRNR